MSWIVRTSLLGFCALVGLGVAAERVTIADLLKAPEKYDSKVVTVTGTVNKFKAKVSKKGNDYFNMRLESSRDEWISVYGQGKLDKVLHDGDTVEVTGDFAQTKKVGDVTFKNEVDVTKRSVEEKTKDFGIRIVKSAGQGSGK